MERSIKEYFRGTFFDRLELGIGKKKLSKSKYAGFWPDQLGEHRYYLLCREQILGESKEHQFLNAFFSCS